MRVYEPTVEFERPPASEKTLRTVEGGSLGILSNGWRSFHFIADRWEELATGPDFGVAEVVNRKHHDPAGPAPEEHIADVITSSGVLSGVGN